MKKLLATLLIVFTVTLCKAQWVTIPDANFVAFLQQNYPSCMNGNLMDTTCSAIVNEDTFDCCYHTIYNLEGIQYFNSLTAIYCDGNNITSLPVLPQSLTVLSCSNNSLASLPSLPSSLKELECWNNFLTILPNLPNTLFILNCDSNLLTNLPVLPTSLSILICGGNQMVGLPVLPNSLSVLFCEVGQLESLPALPNSLIKLVCSDNHLSSLPPLPPTLNNFQVQNNPGLLCMPPLLNFTGSDFFDVTNTGITCFPNAIQHTGYIAAIDTMPICSCTFPTGISTSNITSTSAKVSWSTECCSQFQIQKRVTGTTTWSTVAAVVTATSKNLTALTPGATYDLRMRVKCTDGTTYSSWSPIQTFTTLVTCVAPTGVTVTNLTQTHATINWAAVTGAYSYKFSGRKLGTTAWTTYTIYAPLTVKQLNGLTANTTYQYRMQTVCNASGVPTSPWTAISTFTTPLRMEDESKDNATINFSIYPNPVSEKLTVICNQLTVSDFEIKDLLGRVLITQNASDETSNTIDVSNLSAAQYFISIRRNDGSVLIKQFVKE